jgi:predicted XRE-type DNA-binding protein
MKAKSNKIAMTPSSGNVFADLELPRPEERLAKAGLTLEIERIIRKRGLTQTQAGTILGIDQPKVSALRNGRLSGFSVERLIRFLNALDRDVEIVVKAKPPSRRHAHISVKAA